MESVPELWHKIEKVIIIIIDSILLRYVMLLRIAASLRLSNGGQATLLLLQECSVSLNLIIRFINKARWCNLIPLLRPQIQTFLNFLRNLNFAGDLIFC
jgi:hypothetical protein